MSAEQKAGASPDRAAAPLLEVRGIEKSFPGVRALSGVSFAVRPGEVHALLGENGAGKSTLIKIVSGVYQPDVGSILVNGTQVDFSSPDDARRAGVATIYQELLLFPELSVAENIFLGHAPLAGAGRIDWRAMRTEARRLLDSLEIDDLSPDQIVGVLTVGNRQRVEILRALSQDARILIMDEPTAALTESDVTRLFDVVRRLKQRGVGIVYISHRLDEIFAIADRVTVLRDGRRAGTWARAQMSRKTIIEAIVGGDKAWSDEIVGQDSATGEVVLAAEGVAGGRVEDFSFVLRAGEILGVAGLPGSGAEEALDLLFGRFPMTRGRLRLNGAEVVFRSPRDAKEAGVAMVPKDRHAESLLPGASVRENISLPNLGRFVADPAARFINRGKERAEALAIAEKLKIKMPGIEASIDSLSGGNQQKAILGRWLASGAKVFMLNSPTAAVDIGAKAEIYHLIREIAASGAAVLFTSTEVEEFPRICHRVLVFRDGRIVGEASGRSATETTIMHLAVGGEDER